MNFTGKADLLASWSAWRSGLVKWLGEGRLRRYFTGEWQRRGLSPCGWEWETASDWDVTGAIFDKAKSEHTSVDIRWYGSKWAVSIGYSNFDLDDLHTAALECAVKYTMEKAK
jgi:hypothetical protein